MPTVEETAIARLRELNGGGKPAAGEKRGPITAVKEWHKRWRNGTLSQKISVWALTILVAIAAIAVSIMSAYVAIAGVLMLGMIYVFVAVMTAYTHKPSARERILRGMRGSASSRRRR